MYSAFGIYVFNKHNKFELKGFQNTKKNLEIYFPLYFYKARSYPLKTNMKCNVKGAMCKVQRAMYGVQCAVCCVQIRMYRVQCTECKVYNAMKCTEFNVYNAM